MSFAFFGHKILETIYESPGTVVYKALNESTNQVVILKVTKQEDESIKKKASYHLEKDIIDILKTEDTQTKTESSEGVPSIFGIEEIGDQNVLILQDCGKPLTQVIQEKGAFSIPDFFKIAIQVTEILGDIHQHHVIHKDIKPSNILLDPTENNFYIIDFNISSLLSSEKEGIDSTKVLEGSLPYMSPEQTGRMNRAIDYRTDFYSLGISFFQLLTGRPPYESDEILDMVHFHIAKEIPSIRKINNQIPVQIEKIIGKLTNKNAEDRYQTAYGLLKDLTKCQEFYNEEKDIPEFPLGTQDVSGHFTIPQKLYGREQEIKILLDQFENVSTGAKVILTITGVSGIGKTSLVHEVHRPIVSKQGFFLSGKFEQFKRDIPYSALRHAFSELAKQLLVTSEKKVDIIKQDLQDIIGKYGRVITDFSPSLSFLFKELPELDELPPTEALSRFNLNVFKFFKALTSSQHPIVMFIDDLQWADGASLDLFKNLIFSEDLNYFLFIGAYRDNEVDSTHPLIDILENIKINNLNFNELKVKSFKKEDIQQFLFDMFGWSYQETSNITDNILIKTRGNPFFVTEFLKTLYDKKLIYFSQNDGKWFFDEDRVLKIDVSDNVVELMIEKLKNLPEERQNHLMLGSCLGTVFSLNHLSIISETRPLQSLKNLWPLIKSGLIIPIGTDYALLQALSKADDKGHFSDEKINELNIRYRFVHDRIQQAANELSSAKEKEVIYLKIARLLSETLSEDEFNERIFDITNFYNHGRVLIDTPSEINALAALNHQTAIRALKNIAFRPALKYITNSAEIYGKELTKNDFNKYYDINLLLVECLYLNHEFDLAKKKAIDLLFQTKDDFQKVDIYIHLLTMHAIQTFNREASSYALKALEILGVRESINTGRVRFALVYLYTLFKLRNYNFNDLIDNPPITDQRLLKILQVLSAGIPSLYLHKSELVMAIIFRTLIETHKFKGTPDHIVMIGCFAAIEIFFRFKFKKASRILSVANKLSDIYPEDKMKGRMGLVKQYVLSRFNVGISEALKVGKDAAIASTNAGDSIYACTNAASNAYTYSLLGVSVQETLNLALSAKELSSKLKVFDMYWASNMTVQLCYAFQGKTDHIGTMESSSFSEKEIDEALDEDHQPMRVVCLTVQLLNRAISGKEEDYHFIISSLKKYWDFPFYLAGAMGTYACYLYLGLAAVGLKKKTNLFKRILFKSIMVFATRHTKFHYKNNPENFGVFYYMIKGLNHLYSSRNKKAKDAFIKAHIQSTKTHQRLYTALSLEVIGKILLDEGKLKEGYDYLLESAHQYEGFGAPKKVKEMAKQYGGVVEKFYLQTNYNKSQKEQKEALKKNLLNPKSNSEKTISLRNETESIPQNQTHTTTQFSTTTNYGETNLDTSTEASSNSSDSLIDFETLFKSSQILSQEINPQKILNLMLDILLKNSGATKIVLVEHSKEKNTFNLTAEIDINGQNNKDQKSEDQKVNIFDSKSALPLQLMKFLIEGKKMYLTGDATKESKLETDPYIQEFSPKSILAIPIMKEDKICYILYLENKIMSMAFTSDRIHLLELLISQMSISIENATLYEKLEEKVKERTLDLRTAQQKIISIAHKSGMADIASDILHNIGNILPSFYFFLNEFQKIAGNNILSVFSNTLKWLQSVGDKNWDQFFNQDPKGQKIVPLINKLEEEFQKIDKKIGDLVPKLSTEVEKIETVIAKHQSNEKEWQFNTTFFIKELVEEVQQLFPQVAKGKSIQLLLQFDSAMEIYNDRQKLQIIINELFKNCYEELLENEQSEKTIKFSIEQNQASLIFTIEDNGRGIPQDLIKKLLQKENVSTKKDSTGLGIRDTLDFIQSLNGQLEIDNLEVFGIKGTRFTVKLPLLKTAQEELEKEPPKAA